MAVTMSALTVWLAHRADAVLFLGALVGQRMRDAFSGGVHDAVVATVGQGAATTVTSNGLAGVALGLSALGVAVLGTALLSTGRSQSVMSNNRVVNQDGVGTFSWRLGEQLDMRVTFTYCAR